MKITVSDAFDVGEIVWNWAEMHPEAKKDFRIMYEYVPALQALRLTMERAYTDETKYGIVRLLPEDILGNMVCPSDYINATLEEMYKKLMESEEMPKRMAIAHILKGGEDENMPDSLVEEFKSALSKSGLRPVDNDTMLKMAKAAVVKWYNEHNQSCPIGIEDVYITWFCKVLQNWKALAGTHHSDGMYYEVTYDGDKDAAYVDAYKKWQNVSMSGEDIRDNVRRW